MYEKRIQLKPTLSKVSVICQNPPSYIDEEPNNITSGFSIATAPIPLPDICSHLVCEYLGLDLFYQRREVCHTENASFTQLE
jgi:hypothetical protein